MGELRELVSEYISLVALYDDKHIKQIGAERGAYFDNVTKLAAKIRLHLNYRDEKDTRIMELVDSLRMDTMKLYSNVNQFLKNNDEKIFGLGENFQEAFRVNLASILNNSHFETTETNTSKGIELAFGEAWNQTVEKYNREFVEGTKSIRDVLIRNVEELTRQTQIYLKDEWNRVKDEANRGDLSKSPLKSFLRWAGIPILVVAICVLIIA